MMKWYYRYFEIYGISYGTISPFVLKGISSIIVNKQSKCPLVSVVVIAHNEEKHILSCLWSLAENECKYPYEIIVVDNASTDKTAELCNKMGVQSLYEKEKGPGCARQCGLDHAHGKYCVCADADTIYPKYYLQTMIDKLSKHNVVAVYGLWSFLPDQDLPAISLFFYELLRDCYLILQDIKRPELNVRGMAMAFRVVEARKYGFRKDLIRGEDGFLALNMKKDGEIKMILSRRARPITSNRILKERGTLAMTFMQRLKKMTISIGGLFSRKQYYEDRDDNIIKKDE
jgi:glycosyltransferase involved in cell wall biosynthesis